MTDPRITGLLRTRARATEAGDLNVARACTVELGYLGYSDEEPSPENTAAAALPENTALPGTRTRRRPR